MSATIFAGNLTITYGVIAHLGLIWYLERWDEPRYDNTVVHLYYTHRGAHAYHLYLVADGRVQVYLVGSGRVTGIKDGEYTSHWVEPGLIPVLIDHPDQLWDHIAWDRSDTHDHLAELGMV